MNDNQPTLWPLSHRDNQVQNQRLNPSISINETSAGRYAFSSKLKDAHVNPNFAYTWHASASRTAYVLMCLCAYGSTYEAQRNALSREVALLL